MAAIPKKDGKEDVVYQGRIVEIVNQPMLIGDKKMVFEFARRSPGTRLIIVDEAQKRVLLTQEYRHEHDVYDFRLPGGKVFDTLDEYNTFLQSGRDIVVPAADRAIIEAKEETGLVVRNPKHYYTSVNGTTMMWDLMYFTITDWDESEQELETGEDISVVWVPYKEVEEYALTRMSEDRSAIVLLRWLKERNS